MKNLINRHNRRIRALEYGIVPRKKGRPRKHEIINGESKDNEIKRQGWKINCCEIFFVSLEGSEAKS